MCPAHQQPGKWGAKLNTNMLRVRRLLTINSSNKTNLFLLFMLLQVLLSQEAALVETLWAYISTNSQTA
jgi:hypothetical protein